MLMDNTEPLPQHSQSHLFTVRLWVETLSHHQSEVRIQVKHVLSGETRYFRDGELVLAYLLTKVQEVERTSRRGEDSS